MSVPSPSLGSPSPPGKKPENKIVMKIGKKFVIELTGSYPFLLSIVTVVLIFGGFLIAIF